jgi:hypothetical protein
MTASGPYIAEDRRPEMVLDPNKRLLEITVGELQSLLAAIDQNGTQPGTGKQHKDVTDKGTIRDGGDGFIKFSSDTGGVQKNATKDQADKASADNKSQADFKVSTDKQSLDSSSSSAASADQRGILTLLRQCLNERTPASDPAA